MQAHTVLLLCTAFVLGYARPQGNVVDASGPFGGQHGGPGGGSFALLLSAQKFRSILVAYFPDTWVAAWDAIPDATKLCLMQETMRAIQRQQVDSRTAFQQSQAQCPQDQDKIQAFGKAVEDSFNALPDKLKQIGTTLCDKITAATEEMQKGNLQPLFAALSEFFEALKALTQEDREAIAAVFPKLRNLITATEINDIFDGGDKMVLGLGEIVTAIKSLAQKL
ncbi:hypothetical protein AAVH_36129 [Aphelenchoides avenae]|nr:hypothetical protein AAVH_36129 [Aphelenchus avenae]